jgi:hypothetical protein
MFAIEHSIHTLSSCRIQQLLAVIMPVLLAGINITGRTLTKNSLVMCSHSSCSAHMLPFTTWRALRLSCAMVLRVQQLGSCVQ